MNNIRDEPKTYTRNDTMKQSKQYIIRRIKIMFESLNKIFPETVKEGIDTKELDYIALKEFVGREVEVAGYFFNDKGNYGRQVVVVGRSVGTNTYYNINMPARYVEQFEAINSNDTMRETVLSGGLMLKDIKMVDTKNGTTVACEFVG